MSKTQEPQYKTFYSGTFDTPIELDYMYPFKIFADLRERLDKPGFNPEDFKRELLAYIHIFLGNQIREEQLVGGHILADLQMVGKEDELIEYFFKKSVSNRPHFVHLGKIYENLKGNKIQEAKDQLEKSVMDDFERKIILDSDTIRTWRITLQYAGETKTITVLGTRLSGEYKIITGDEALDVQEYNVKDAVDIYENILNRAGINQNREQYRENLKACVLQIASADAAVKGSSVYLGFLNIDIQQQFVCSIRITDQRYTIDLDNRSVKLRQECYASYNREDSDQEGRLDHFIVNTHQFKVPENYNPASGALKPINHHINYVYDEVGLQVLHSQPELHAKLVSSLTEENVHSAVHPSYSMPKHEGFVEIFQGTITRAKETDYTYPLLIARKVRQDIQNGTYDFNKFQHALAEYIRANNIAKNNIDHVHSFPQTDEEVIDVYFNRKKNKNGTITTGEIDDPYKAYLARVYDHLYNVHVIASDRQFEFSRNTVYEAEHVPPEPFTIELVEKAIKKEIFREVTLNITDRDGEKHTIHINGMKVTTDGKEEIAEEDKLVPHLTKKLNAFGVGENQALYILNQLSSKDALTKTSSDYFQKIVADSNQKITVKEDIPTYYVNLKEKKIKVISDVDLIDNDNPVVQAKKVIRYEQELSIPTEIQLQQNFVQDQAVESARVLVDETELQRFADLSKKQGLVDKISRPQFCQEFVSQAEEMNKKLQATKDDMTLVFDGSFVTDKHESDLYALNIILDAEDRINKGLFDFEEFKREIIEHYRVHDKHTIIQRAMGIEELKDATDDQVISYFMKLKGSASNNYDIELVKLYEYLAIPTNDPKKYEFEVAKKELILSKAYTVDLDRLVGKDEIKVIDRKGKEHKLKFSKDQAEDKYRMILDGTEYMYKTQSEFLEQVKVVAKVLDVDHRNLLYIFREMSFQDLLPANEKAVYRTKITQESMKALPIPISNMKNNDKVDAKFIIDLNDNSLEVSYNEGLQDANETVFIKKAFHIKMKFFYPKFDENSPEELPRVQNTRKQITVYKGKELEENITKLVGDENKDMATNKYWAEFFNSIYEEKKVQKQVGLPKVEVAEEQKPTTATDRLKSFFKPIGDAIVDRFFIPIYHTLIVAPIEFIVKVVKAVLQFIGKAVAYFGRRNDQNSESVGASSKTGEGQVGQDQKKEQVVDVKKEIPLAKDVYEEVLGHKGPVIGGHRPIDGSRPGQPVGGDKKVVPLDPSQNRSVD